MKTKTGYYMYAEIPGFPKAWVLAVCALSRKDANEYMKAWHKGGKFVYSVVDGGNIKANGGAVTFAAAKILKENMQAMYENQ